MAGGKGRSRNLLRDARLPTHTAPWLAADGLPVEATVTGRKTRGENQQKTSLDAPSPTCETMPAYLLMLSASCVMANSMRRETMCRDV